MGALRLACLAAAALVLGGCGDIFGNKDAHAPGTQLGTFHVTATLASGTCGDNALGAPATWEFDVKLAKGEGSLYWDNGAQQVSGTLAADGATFDVESEVIENMRTEAAPGPACSVGRSDKATGTLVGKDADVTSFSGQLSYAFAAQAGSECDDLVAATAPPNRQPIFAALPCSIAYAFTAPRTAAPAAQ
jgi:hypothetical protein